MVYHWQSHNVKLSGVDDMVLLPKISEDAIVENLKKRYMDDYIFTCIGPVLVSVNPFKQMPYFGEREIDIYQGAAPYENPPHIYAVADDMYRNMLIDNESQCVIISGESGAGKTVAAKYIMAYVARVSGGGHRVQHVKDVILESNPLLEAFGNAKTVRNNNSSRFGKYVEMLFGSGGQPEGGKISNFLLEKSRVTMQNAGERTFHIFYQLCTGATNEMKKDFALADLDYYHYLSYGGNHKVEGTNDAKDFQETLKAMSVMGMSQAEQTDVLRLVAGILNLGNIAFAEKGNYSEILNGQTLMLPAYLLDVQVDQLQAKLTGRRFDSKWGDKSETIDVSLNVEQAVYTRNALAKGLYARLFDFLVKRVNSAMETSGVDRRGLAILDIYGFEIFEKNGFEQFCINFVNEKLQQIFIELTLKAEQEEYVAEKIQWTPVEFFNNQVVVDLMEARRPPGLFLVLDDVCATMHAVSDGVDLDLQKKMNAAANTHPHFNCCPEGFVVKHYAGIVTYSVAGFCDRNRDLLFPDLIELMYNSGNAFVRSLFHEGATTAAASSTATKTRPTTSGSKIRTQANKLVEELKKCTPHYIRCIKPNETKKPRDWDELRVKHQVEYLGLKENIRVRRAGFAYRRPFSKFLYRYAIITPQTWPRWHGVAKAGIIHIMNEAGLDSGQYQLGITKVFIKAPETLFLLEELRERKYNYFARVIQRAFKKYFASRQRDKHKNEAAQLVFGKKERRRYSINRNFSGDYIGLDTRTDLQGILPRRDKVLFAESIKKYDRRFQVTRRDLILTNRELMLIGREMVKKGKEKGKVFPVYKRRLPLDSILHVTLSPYMDDFVIIHVRDNYDSVLELMFKTEFILLLNKQYRLLLGRDLSVKFINSVEFRIKKEGWGGGSSRTIKWNKIGEIGDISQLKSSGRTLQVNVGTGLPSNTKPIMKRITQSSMPSSVRTPALQPAGFLPATIRPQLAPRPVGVQPSRGPRMRIAPPPPSEPAPPNQPVRPGFQLRPIIPNSIPNGVNFNNNNILKKPVPGGGKPKPPVKPKPPAFPRVRALYTYQPQDLDEIGFEEGEEFELIQEHKEGWWLGCHRGKRGLFPANYIEKI